MNNGKSKPWYSFVPSLLTSLNLVCGVLATYFSLEGKINIACVLIFIAALFDFVDGFAARLLKVSGDFGKELDSLADLISFGMVPGAMLFFIQKSHFTEFPGSASFTLLQWIFLLSPILIPVFSALRLAKFNIDVRQQSEFIGLPTPANALFFAALCFTFLYKPDHFLNGINQPVILTIFIFLFSYLLVAEIPLFALKFKTFKWKGNALRYIFILSSAILFLLLGIPGFSAIIILYIILSLFRNLTNKSKGK